MSSRPTVSPYLNLLRRGQSPALNYYNLVRPQNQFYQSIQQLQQDVGTNAQDLSVLQQTPTGLPPTGHLAGFMTQGAYFMTMGRGQLARPPQQSMTTPGLGGRTGTGSALGQGGSGMTGMQSGQTGMPPMSTGRRTRG